MPNPVTMIATQNGRAHFKREASHSQRAIFRQNGEIVLTLVPIFPNTPSGYDNILAGTYEVTHEYNDTNGWKKGRGRLQHSGWAQFDDGPEGGGDNDFNDMQTWFEYP